MSYGVSWSELSTHAHPDRPGSCSPGLGPFQSISASSVELNMKQKALLISGSAVQGSGEGKDERKDLAHQPHPHCAQTPRLNALWSCHYVCGQAGFQQAWPTVPQVRHRPLPLCWYGPPNFQDCKGRFL